jgi:sortase (surface protein transpeptidase)
MSDRLRGLVVLLVALAALTACSSAPEAPPAESRTETEVAPVAKPTGLSIPAINVHVAQLMELGVTSEGKMQTPDDAVTIGWYALGAAPGAVGPATLAAHVNLDGVQGTFARLHELKQGDDVTVRRRDGTDAMFVIDRVEQYPKATFPDDLVWADVDRPELRLVTCGGDLDRAAGSYRDNVIAFAHLR